MRRKLLIILVGVFCAFGLQADRADAQQVANPPELSLTCGEAGAHTARLYRTMFNRQADRSGLLYWLGQRYGGMPSDVVAHWMSQGPEFRYYYGDLDDGAFVGTIYRNLLGREAEPEGLAYWTSLVPVHGRANVANWMTQAPEFALVWPFEAPALCGKTQALGLREVKPGLHVGTTGATVTVIGQRDLVDYRAVTTRGTFAWWVGGDVVVNANWFGPFGVVGPVVSGGRILGGRDSRERGQIVSWRPECRSADQVLEHVWTGDIWTPDACVLSAVSGVSLVHKGVRADAYPGFNITTGPTNTGPAHSFIGFNDTEIVVIATRGMSASRLADYAISLGVTEGVMLDGGRSTQIRTPLVSFSSGRPVPVFAVLDSLAR